MKLASRLKEKCSWISANRNSPVLWEQSSQQCGLDKLPHLVCLFFSSLASLTVFRFLSLSFCLSGGGHGGKLTLRPWLGLHGKWRGLTCRSGFPGRPDERRTAQRRAEERERREGKEGKEQSQEKRAEGPGRHVQVHLTQMSRSHPPPPHVQWWFCFRAGSTGSSVLLCAAK